MMRSEVVDSNLKTNRNAKERFPTAYIRDITDVLLFVISFSTYSQTILGLLDSFSHGNFVTQNPYVFENL